MGGGGRNRREQDAWNAQARSDNAAITQVDPLEQQLRDRSSRRLAWESGGRTNIEDPNAGLQDYIQIGKSALDRADRERYGTGALQLGNEANAGHIADLKELNKSNMAREFGAGLEQADAMAHAEATGSVMPLAQMTTNRNIARAQNSGQMFSQWNQRQSKNWWDYLREGVGVASQVGGMIAGGI